MNSRKMYVNISGDVYSVIDRESKLTTTNSYMNHILRDYFTMKGLLPAETAVRKYSFPLSESDYEDCKRYLDINKFSDIDTYIEHAHYPPTLNSQYLVYGSNCCEAQRNVDESFMLIFEDFVKSFEVVSYDFDDIFEFAKKLAYEINEDKKRHNYSVSENDAILIDDDIMNLKGEPVDTRERLELIFHLIESRFGIKYSEAEKVYTSAFKMLFNYLSKHGVKMHNRVGPKGFYFLVFYYVDFKLALKYQVNPLSWDSTEFYDLSTLADSRELRRLWLYISKDITPEATTDRLHQ